MRGIKRLLSGFRATVVVLLLYITFLHSTSWVEKHILFPKYVAYWENRLRPLLQAKEDQFQRLLKRITYEPPEYSKPIVRRDWLFRKIKQVDP